LTPEILLRAGLSPPVKVLDLKDRLRCRGVREEGAGGGLDQVARVGMRDRDILGGPLRC
jgi:hypothetical protein